MAPAEFTKMDVSGLVAQMHETLSKIHETISSLNTSEHDSRLDELEQQRDGAISALRAAFESESEQLSQKRKVQSDEIAERRRKEDEERERRRRQEDEELAERIRAEDASRHERHESDQKEVEDETDGKIDEIEGQATHLIEDGRQKLNDLEEKRKEINRLIDEQLKMPLPAISTRTRRGTRSGPNGIAVNSKQAPPNMPDEQADNLGVKAPKEPATGDSLPREAAPQPSREVAAAAPVPAPAETTEQGLVTEAEDHSHAAAGEEMAESAKGAGNVADESRAESLEPAVPAGVSEKEHADVGDVDTQASEALEPTQDSSRDAHVHESEGTHPDNSSAPAKSLFGSWGRTMRNLVGRPNSSGQESIRISTPAHTETIEPSSSASVPGEFPTTETETESSGLASREASVADDPGLTEAPQEPSPTEESSVPVQNDAAANDDVVISEPHHEDLQADQHQDQVTHESDHGAEHFVERSPPDEDDNLPVEEASQPVEETSLLVEEAGLPVEEAHLQAQNASLPVEETSLPVEETSLPAEAASRPVEDASLPTEEAIPGTITHGSDPIVSPDSLKDESTEAHSDEPANDAIAIPGTMTHGPDSDVTTKAEDVKGHNGIEDASVDTSLPEIHGDEAAASPVLAHPETLGTEGAESHESLPIELQHETLDSIAEAAPRIAPEDEEGAEKISPVSVPIGTQASEQFNLNRQILGDNHLDDILSPPGDAPKGQDALSSNIEGIPRPQELHVLDAQPIRENTPPIQETGQNVEQYLQEVLVSPAAEPDQNDAPHFSGEAHEDEQHMRLGNDVDSGAERASDSQKNSVLPVPDHEAQEESLAGGQDEEQHVTVAGSTDGLEMEENMTPKSVPPPQTFDEAAAEDEKSPDVINDDQHGSDLVGHAAETSNAEVELESQHPGTSVPTQSEEPVTSEELPVAEHEDSGLQTNVNDEHDIGGEQPVHQEQAEETTDPEDQHHADFTGQELEHVRMVQESGPISSEATSDDPVEVNEHLEPNFPVAQDEEDAADSVDQALPEESGATDALPAASSDDVAGNLPIEDKASPDQEASSLPTEIKHDQLKAEDAGGAEDALPPNQASSLPQTPVVEQHGTVGDNVSVSTIEIDIPRGHTEVEDDEEHHDIENQSFRNDGDTVDYHEARPDLSREIPLNADSALGAEHAEFQHSPNPDQLGPGDWNTDSESQPFVTPMASAGLQSPLNFEDNRTFDGQDEHAEQGEYYDRNDENSYQEHYNPLEDPQAEVEAEMDDDSHFGLDDEHTTTVHGADDLFDDDGSEEHDDVHETYDEYGEVPHEEGDEAFESNLDEAPREVQDSESGVSVTEHFVTIPDQHDDDEPRTAVPAFEEPRRVIDEAEEDPVHVTHGQEGTSTPQLHPTQPVETPEISPLALRQTPSSMQRGLASSRHNPVRPKTPTEAERPKTPLAVEEPTTQEEYDPDSFMPRDVTNVPWHARNDSVPMSLHSQSTLSSAPSSPIHSSLPVDNHEPVIRDSWPAPAHSQYLNGRGSLDGRPRNASQASDYDPFKYDEKPRPTSWYRQEPPSTNELSPDRGNADSNTGYGSHRNSVSSSSGSLFRKLRNVFEQPNAGDQTNAPSVPSHFTGGGPNGTGWSGKGSPVRSRPISTAFYPVAKVAPGGSHLVSPSKLSRPAQQTDEGYDTPDDKRGGFLNEAEDDIDERSALLNSSSEDLTAN